MGKVKRVALYARVSTDGQSVENQLRELEAVAERHGWAVAEVFRDAGVSGATAERPGYKRLKQAVARKEVDLVAAWSVDRLGRSLQELVALLGELRAKGVDLYLHQQGLDTSTPAGKAMFQMLGVFAEFERAMIVERVQAGLRRARAQGKRLGRPRVGEKVEAAIRRELAKGARHPCRGAGGRGRRRDGAAGASGTGEDGVRRLPARRGLLPETDLLSWLCTYREPRGVAWTITTTSTTSFLRSGPKAIPLFTPAENFGPLARRLPSRPPPPRDRAGPGRRRESARRPPRLCRITTVSPGLGPGEMPEGCAQRPKGAPSGADSRACGRGIVHAPPTRQQGTPTPGGPR